MARRLGVKTVLNPAPAVPVPEEIFALCDYLTPNETEAAGLTGMPVASVDDALRAGEALMARGAPNVVITLGGRGALIRSKDFTRHVPAVEAGDLVDRPAPETPFAARSRSRSPRERHWTRRPDTAARRRDPSDPLGHGARDAGPSRSRRVDGQTQSKQADLAAL